MKTVGIIGGVGPETTAEFYLELIFGCYEKNQVSRPPILIWNIPLEYQIEEDLLTKSHGEERYIPYLVDAAKRLEKGGADFLVMPCNSLHIFIDKIRSAVSVPVLSIVEETAKFLSSKGVDKVGVLATSTTVGKKLYENALMHAGIGQILPDDFEQAKIGKIINDIVLNRHANRDRDEFMKIVENMSNKVSDIILACTDLQLLIPSNDKAKIFDTMQIFADATVDVILEEN
jgi:aspartate racemase